MFIARFRVDRVIVECDDCRLSTPHGEVSQAGHGLCARNPRPTDECVDLKYFGSDHHRTTEGGDSVAD